MKPNRLNRALMYKLGYLHNTLYDKFGVRFIVTQSSTNNVFINHCFLSDQRNTALGANAAPPVGTRECARARISRGKTWRQWVAT